VAEESVTASEKLFKAEQISQNSLLLAEIELESARIAQQNARNEDRESWRRLAAVVGAPALEPAPLEGDLNSGLPDYQWDERLAVLMAESPELSAARSAIDRAQVAVRRAYRERLPDVEVGVGLRHDNHSGDDLTDVQIGFPLPIFNRNQGNIYAARAELLAAEGDMRQIELGLQDRLAMAFRRYDNARHEVQRYADRILPRARQSLELVRKGYEERQIDYLTLLASQRTFFQTSLAYLQSVRELREAAILIEGQLLNDSLDTRK
jgi:cobalt-zinc-cadmium efflux system outer membrane protein